MEASKKIDIYTLSEYIEKVDSLPYTNCLFRGEPALFPCCNAAGFRLERRNKEEINEIIKELKKPLGFKVFGVILPNGKQKGLRKLFQYRKLVD